MILLDFLLAEVALEQAFESLAVAGLVAGHFVHGVMDGVQTQLLGEVLTTSTKKNLELRAEAEYGACLGKTELAKLAKAQNLDAIHDTVHEMARDEARHGHGFEGLLKRYFGK